jgi:ElaB/YqjD/DUF883 family membrane-anchored ribosome-binding protein
MSTSEQLERETEEERARISETLDELRARMTPGHVVDRLVDYATDSSGGMFFRNLRQQAVDNPVPAALVGAGLAWLAISGRRASASRTSADNLVSRTTDKISAAGDKMADRARHAADSASDTASKWSDQARSAAADLGQRGQTTASNLQDTARETADSAADTAPSSYAAVSELADDATSRVQGAARSAVDSLAETTSTTYDAAADQARRAGDRFQKSASDMGGKVAASGRSIMDFVYEQPLVLVGLGLAIGAAFGAASPSTEAEDELMGESSDALKEETADLAKKHLKKGQAVAEQAWQSATEEAEKQGLASSCTERDAAVTSHLDSATDETPLVPSTKTPANAEDQRSEH